MKKILLLLAGVALVVGVFGLNSIRRGESGESLLHVAAPDALPVVVTEPVRQSITRIVQAPGEVEAVLEVEIRSEIAAKIEEMPVEEGDVVEAGQLLCRLNDDEFRARVESGEAGVARLAASIREAEADLAQCKFDCARRERLAQVDAASDIELAEYRTRLLKAQANVDVWKASLEEAEAMLRSAREYLNKTVITSPIAGVVSQIRAKPGEVVVTGTMNNPGTVIMTVTDLSQMQVKARVDETDVPLVKPGQGVEIFLPSDPQRAIPGRVLRVATSGAKQAGRDVVTFETLVMVESDDSAIKPAMTANVEIQVESREDALTIPVQAVVHRKRRDLPEKLVEEFTARLAELDSSERASRAQYLQVVFCMEDEEARPHLVRTGIADEANVELVEGVAVADRVIVGPYRSLDQLKDGSKVKLEEDKKEAGEADQETEEEARMAEVSEEETETTDSDSEVAKAQ